MRGGLRAPRPKYMPRLELSEAYTASCIDTSTTRPTPVFSRSYSAIMMPPNRCTPPKKSHSAGPAFTGGLSAKPVIAITPDIAWIVRSIAG